MQSIEAVISLMCLVMLLSFLLGAAADQQGIDDSLYKFQLANDVWRILFLKGHLQDFSFDQASTQRDLVEQDLEEIHFLTGLCTHMGGIKASSCRGIPTTEVVTVKKMLYVDGLPSNTSLTLAIPD